MPRSVSCACSASTCSPPQNRRVLSGPLPYHSLPRPRATEAACGMGYWLSFSTLAHVVHVHDCASPAARHARLCRWRLVRRREHEVYMQLVVLCRHWRICRKRGEFGVWAAKGWVQAQLGVKLAAPGHAACAQRQRVDGAQREQRHSGGAQRRGRKSARETGTGFSSPNSFKVKLDSNRKPQRQHLTCLFHPTRAHRTVLIGFLGQWGWRRHTAGTGPAVRHGRYPEPAPPRPVHAAGVADVSAHPRGAHRPQRERRKVAGSSLLKRCCRTSASLSRCLLAGA